MKTVKTELEGVLIIEPIVFYDNRGYFMEYYSTRKLDTLGISSVFVQDNLSHSRKINTLRGLHFQNNPRAQAKIVRCARGKILDISVDIRRGSPTYCKWVSIELSEDNFKQVYIPSGFAHGFVTLTDDVEVQYKASDFYMPAYDRSIRWDDPDIGINWGINTPILSDKDKIAPFLRDSDCNFVWNGVNSDD